MSPSVKHFDITLPLLRRKPFFSQAQNNLTFSLVFLGNPLPDLTTWSHVQNAQSLSSLLFNLVRKYFTLFS
jgi:hypothetical protein